MAEVAAHGFWLTVRHWRSGDVGLPGALGGPLFGYLRNRRIDSLGTKQRTSRAADQVADGTAWRDFCRELEQAGEAVFGGKTPTDPFNRAEGTRYLTRLLRAGLESNLESSDPCYPRFFQLSNETIKIGNDNPDNVYHNANVSGAYDYRIRGHRGSVPYLTFGTKGGSYETDRTMRPTGQLDLPDMQVDQDGHFVIEVSCEEKPGNWLPMEPGTSGMIVRQTFDDRARETPARYTIECLNPDRSDTLRAESIEAALSRTTAFVRSTSGLFVDWMDGFKSHTNELPPNDQDMCQDVGGDSNIYYHNSHWRLGPEDALLVEVTPPVCTTWNFQISDFWMESLDYRYHRIHLNKHTAHYEADGSVRIVLAHADPGPDWPNWLSTCDHEQGAMLFRYVDTKETPPIATRVVALGDLAALV